MNAFRSLAAATSGRHVGDYMNIGDPSASEGLALPNGLFAMRTLARGLSERTCRSLCDNLAA